MLLLSVSPCGPEKDFSPFSPILGGKGVGGGTFAELYQNGRPGTRLVFGPV